jgi:hypothetical protein
MQGGKNWILSKEMNANRFFRDFHLLEIWKTTYMYVPLWTEWRERGYGLMISEESLEATDVAIQ